MIVTVQIERTNGWDDYESTVRWSGDTLKYKSTLKEVIDIALESYPEDSSVHCVTIKVEDPTVLPQSRLMGDTYESLRNALAKANDRIDELEGDLKRVRMVRNIWKKSGPPSINRKYAVRCLDYALREEHVFPEEM